MSNTRKKKKILLASMSLVTLGAAILLGVSTLNDDFANSQLYAANQNNGVYELSLDSSNAVGTAGTHSITSKTGGSVKFVYTSVSSSSGNHTCLSSGGTIINKDIIHSIESFNATFTGHLQARIGYGESSMGEFFDLVSGQTLNFATLPYFLELKATSQTLLKSAKFTYTCETNPAGEETYVERSYDVTFSTHTSDGNLALSTSEVYDEISSGDNYISTVGSASYIYKGISGIKLGKSDKAGTVSFNFDDSTVTETITSIDVSTARYGSDTGSIYVYLNGSSSSAKTITPSDGTTTVNVGTKLTSIKFKTSAKRAYIAGFSMKYESGHSPDVPVDEVGFTAEDNNKTNYDTESIFDNENSLVVRAVKSDGSTTVLDKNQYSYIVKDSDGSAIDTSAKFGTEGNYSLYVSYKEYLPVKIDFVVGEHLYVVDVSGSLSKTSYTTADIFSNYVNGLTVNITFSDGSSKNSITYSEFAENGIGVYLLTPKGITYEQTNPFGVAGIWKVRIYNLEDESMYYDISINVEAIPVSSITLNETEKTLYVGDSLQLVATVNPSEATKKQVSWSSSNEDVATVDENGLVNAIAVGGATITASAIDGSNVYGTCSITVSSKPATQDIDDELVNGNTIKETTTSYSSWTASKINSDAVYEGQSAGSDGTIQLRSNNNNSGIVTSTSGGKIKKVSIEWGSSTQSGRVVDIYAKNSAYSYPSDLYGNDAGTKIGSITCDTDTEFTITGDYEFVGVRSRSGALYMDSITFTWTTEAPTPVTPIYPTSIELTGKSPLSIAETYQLTVDYTPSDTNVKEITFTSSNSGVVSVSSTGLLTGVAVGTATITATAKTSSGTTSDSVSVTVQPTPVTGVSLNTQSTSVKEGATLTLVADVVPANASNKNVTWSSNNTAVATVSNTGVVTGVKAGTATITVTTVDGSKTASCVVTVQDSSGEESFAITYTDLPTAYSSSMTVYTAASGIRFNAINCANYSGKVQFQSKYGYLQNTESLTLQSITIKDRESNTLNVYGGTSYGNCTVAISGENDVYDLTNYSYFKIARDSTGAAYCSSIIVTTGVAKPIDPTAISFDASALDISVGGSKSLSVSYTPSNANHNKEITWSSSNTSVATVTNGNINVSSNATAGQKATITATLTNLPNISASCVVTVTEKKNDAYTILIYMCGADLESDYANKTSITIDGKTYSHDGIGLATSDIIEILNVKNQPDDINIVIETGGANTWTRNSYGNYSAGYNISNTKLQRHVVKNNKIVLDEELSYASMGLTSTFQSFLEYGLQNYPAEKTGVILWNHGGGMRGVCYDEKKDDDSLLTDEVYSAVGGALNNSVMAGQKLEWIGYDACLMQVQDIAEKNSKYFNYMIASEESEAGYGWDYDTWVDDLYAKKSTPVMLKAIVDGFIADNGGASDDEGDQTLSYLNLSYASAYKTAWENMAAQLLNKVTSNNRSSFNSLVKKAKYFAGGDYDYFCTFDAKDFVNKLASNSTFNPGSTYTNAVLSAFNNLVTYSVAQVGAGNAYGLCMYWCNNSTYSDFNTYYTSEMTNFTNWRSLNEQFGYYTNN